MTDVAGASDANSRMLDRLRLILRQRAKNSYLSISKRLSISFLNARNRDFGRKLPPIAFLNGHPNIAIFYFGFFAS